MAGEEEPVLLDPPLHCREYTGLPVLRRSIRCAAAAAAAGPGRAGSGSVEFG